MECHKNGSKIKQLFVMIDFITDNDIKIIMFEFESILPKTLKKLPFEDGISEEVILGTNINMQIAVKIPKKDRYEMKSKPRN